jgi:hypothetical protein
MRFGSVTPRSVKGENRALMGGFPEEGKRGRFRIALRFSPC